MKGNVIRRHSFSADEEAVSAVNVTAPPGHYRQLEARPHSDTLRTHRVRDQFWKGKTHVLCRPHRSVPRGPQPPVSSAPARPEVSRGRDHFMSLCFWACAPQKCPRPLCKVFSVWLSPEADVGRRDPLLSRIRAGWRPRRTHNGCGAPARLH